MKARTERERSYRILALALILFVLSIAGFWWQGSRSVSPSRVVGAPQVATQDLFRTYPDPSTFRTFVFKDGFVSKENTLAFEGRCSDVYVALLIFSSRVDYRQDPSRALVNRAISCPQNKLFSYEFALSDLKNLAEGTYYVISADQGIRGVWYNPK